MKNCEKPSPTGPTGRNLPATSWMPSPTWGLNLEARPQTNPGDDGDLK